MPTSPPSPISTMMSDMKERLKSLEALGFEKRAGEYVCELELVDGEMLLSVTVSPEGEISSRVTDADTGEEYTLHLSEASGAFVGRVRFEYEGAMSKIRAELLKGYRFGSPQGAQIIDYVSKKYGDELEFLWEDTPDNAIYRRADTGKWYLAMLTIKPSKIGLAGEDKIEIIDLHAEPDTIEKIVDGERIFPGYHMNKRHWLTIPLDGRVESAQIFEMIDESYRLAKKK